MRKKIFFIIVTVLALVIAFPCAAQNKIGESQVFHNGNMQGTYQVVWDSLGKPFVYIISTNYKDFAHAFKKANMPVPTTLPGGHVSVPINKKDKKGVYWMTIPIRNKEYEKLLLAFLGKDIVMQSQTPPKG